MPQPTPYTPTTDFSQQEANNASGRSTVNTAALDAEFANIDATLAQTTANLQQIQRDDGRLRDTIVEIHTLDQAVLNLMGGWELKGAWLPATDYAVNDLVSSGEYTYVCHTAHTSGGSFVDTNWTRFGFAGSADAALAAAQASASASSASVSALTASNQAAAALASATSADASEAAAIAAQVSAASSASNAETSATNAANSAAVSTAAAAAITFPIPVASGGTGQTSASASLAALGGVSATALASSAGANSVGFIQSGTGAVARTMQAKNRDFVSVKDYNGVTGDGVTIDQTGVAAAVAHCYSSGDDLYWPDGTYLTTATIPNFHSVRHFGPGVVKRGSDLFYVEPKTSQTNKLYVSTTGNDANDGLSSSEPVADYGVHLTRLSNYGPMLPGIWVIELAAGTYNISASKSVPQNLETRNAVTIKGPTVAHPGVPTAIIDGGSAAVTAISAVGRAKVAVDCVKVQNCLPSVGGGVYVIDGGNLYTNNVHANNCTAGIYAIRGSIIRVSGGIISNCPQGVVGSVGATGTIGYQAASTADGPIIDGCGTGVSLGEVSSVHVDYCTIKNSTGRGLLVYDNSRANVVGSDFQNNAIGSETRTGGVIVDSSAVYNYGTGLANTVAKRRLGDIGSGFETVSRPVRRVVFNRSSSLTHTGNTFKTTLLSPFTIPAQWLTEEDREIRVRVWGTKTGAAGTVSIGVDFGGTTVFQALNAGGNGAHSFKLDASICSVGAAAQRHWYDLQNNLPGTRIGVNGASSIDMSSDRTIDITVQLGNSADSVQVVGIQIDVTG